MNPQANNNENIYLPSTHHQRKLRCSLKCSHPLKYKWRETDNSSSPPNFCFTRSSTLIQKWSLCYTLFFLEYGVLNERVRGSLYRGVDAVPAVPWHQLHLHHFSLCMRDLGAKNGSKRHQRRFGRTNGSTEPAQGPFATAFAGRWALSQVRGFWVVCPGYALVFRPSLSGWMGYT
jgi:hypothetical protein